MIGSLAPVRDEDLQLRPAGEVALPALHDGDEPGEGKDPRRRRPVGAEPERVAHHRPHREAAEHGALGADARALEQLVVEGRQLPVRGVERLRIRIADPRHDVPVVAGRARQRQRRTRRGDVQAPFAVERVGERQQVELVGAAPVMEDEQALRRAVGRPLAIRQRTHATTLSRSAPSGARRKIRA